MAGPLTTWPCLGHYRQQETNLALYVTACHSDGGGKTDAKYFFHVFANIWPQTFSLLSGIQSTLNSNTKETKQHHRLATDSKCVQRIIRYTVKGWQSMVTAGEYRPRIGRTLTWFYCHIGCCINKRQELRWRKTFWVQYPLVWEVCLWSLSH